MLDPLAPGVALGVAVVPEEVSVPGVLGFTVPGVVGGGVVGVAVDGVDCPGVVVCGEVLMPVVPVVPLAPGLEVPGCEVCAPAVPVVCGAKAAAMRTGDVVCKEEDGLAEVHLSATLRMWVTWKAFVDAPADLSADCAPAELAAALGDCAPAPAAAGCPSASTS